MLKLMISSLYLSSTITIALLLLISTTHSLQIYPQYSNYTSYDPRHEFMTSQPRFSPSLCKNIDTASPELPLTFLHMSPLQDDTFDPTVGHVLTPDADATSDLRFTNPAALRAKMINSKFDCPGKLCDAGYSFVRSFPRVRGEKEFPQALAERDFSDPSVTDYGIGALSITVGLPVLFAILFTIVWWCFCCWRSCCNLCGGRIATKKYSDKDQWVCRIALFVWAGLVILTLFLAIASNHGLSRGVDTTVNGIDRGFAFIDNAQTTLATVTDPFVQRMAVVSTILDAVNTLPENPDPANACLNDAAPNTATIKSQIEFQQSVKDMAADVQAIPTFGQVSEVVNFLSPTYAAYWASLAPYTNTAGAVDKPTVQADYNTWAGTTNTGLTGANFNTGLTDSATNALFDDGAEIYAVTATANVMITSSIAPGSKQILYSESAHDITNILTEPYISNDFDTIISMFQTTNIPPAQCNTDIALLNTLIDGLKDIIDLEQSLPNGIVQELQTVQTNVIAEKIVEKWDYSLRQIQSISNKYTASQTRTSAFNAQPLISQLNTLDFTNFDKLEDTMILLNNMYKALPLAIAAAGGSQANQDALTTTSISTLLTNFNTDLTTSNGSGSRWTLKSNEIQTIQPVQECVSTISHQLFTGDYWFSPVDADIKFMVTSTDTISAQVNSQTGFEEVIDNISDRYAGMGTGLAITNLVPTQNYISSTATGFLRNGGTKAARDTLTLLTDALTTMVTVFNQVGLETVLQYDAQSTQDAFDAVDSVVVPHLDHIHKTFQQMVTVLDRNKDVISGTMEVIRNQLLTYLTVAKNHLGACTQPNSLLNVDDLPVSNVIDMLNQMKNIQTSVLPPSATIAAEIQSYDDNIGLLTNLLADTVPNLSTIIHRTSPFSSLIVANDASLIQFEPTTGTTLPQPPSASSATTFLSSLRALDTEAAAITANVVAVTDNMADAVDDFVQDSYGESYQPYTSALASISDASYLPSNRIFQTTNFPYPALIVKDTAWVETNPVATPIVVGTRDHILLTIRVYSEIRAQSGGAILDTINGMSGRLDDVNDAIGQLGGFVTGWGDTRTSIKRNGYVIDQERIIIMDVFIAIGIIMVFCVFIFAAFKVHKLSMLCVMLLGPFIILSFLLSAVHMGAGVVLADGCEDTGKLAQVGIGGATLDRSATAGLVAFISQEDPETVDVYSLYLYASTCEEQYLPQFIRLLRDTTPDSINVQQDNLSIVRDQMTAQLAQYGMTIAPHFNEVVDQLGGFSTVLAQKANAMYDALQCSRTSPVITTIVDDGVCDGVAKSASLLGALLFLSCFCILPGLILGCSAFKRMNTRNHELYRRKFNKADTEQGQIVYAHGYIPGQEHKGEIVHYKIQEPNAIEDGIAYDQLKGFGSVNKADAKMAQY